MWFKKKSTAEQETPAPSQGADSSAAPRRLAGFKLFLLLIVLAGAVIGVAVGMTRLEDRVLAGKAGPVPVAIGVVLAEVPDWMPQELGQQIARSLVPAKASYNDPKLAEKIHEQANQCPWISRVKMISKCMSSDPRMGQVIVKAEYRQPVARVRTAEGVMVYVDRDGVRVDEKLVPQFMVLVADEAKHERMLCFVDRKQAPPRAVEIHYVEVQMAGDLDPAPPDLGQKWNSPALMEGLRLVELINAKPWYNQIRAVDVRNFGGRINKKESFLRMVAQVEKGSPTEIRFGRFPDPAGDYEVTPDRKLSYLDAYAADHGGLLAGKNQYLDLRYDELHVSLN